MVLKEKVNISTEAHEQRRDRNWSDLEVGSHY